jgi:hypothetical protein
LQPGEYVIDSINNPLQKGPQPYIVHPTLVGPDSSMQTGQAGWSPSGSATYRQVAFDANSNTSHDDDDPGNGWNSWEHIQGSIHVNGGDSGGPLFVMRTDAHGHPYRDVFGVLSGTLTKFIGHDYDEYADVTDQSPRGKAWILANVVDTTRTPKWMAKHPGFSWKGDVEYPGACDNVNDADCDHWTNAHDNCPNTYNPDQTSTKDEDWGDVCPPPPPPSDCVAQTSCGGAMYVACTSAADYGATLEMKGSGGAFGVVSSFTPRWRGDNVFLPGPSLAVPQATFRVCVPDENCGAPFDVTLDLSDCTSYGTPGETPPPGPSCWHGCRQE